jgi:hypothetical protein
MEGLALSLRLKDLLGPVTRVKKKKGVWDRSDLVEGDLLGLADGRHVRSFTHIWHI